MRVDFSLGMMVGLSIWNGVIYLDFKEFMSLDSKNVPTITVILTRWRRKVHVRVYDELWKRNLICFIGVVDASPSL